MVIVWSMFKTNREGKNQIYVVDPDGAGGHRITFDEYNYPKWSKNFWLRASWPLSPSKDEFQQRSEVLRKRIFLKLSLYGFIWLHLLMVLGYRGTAEGRSCSHQQRPVKAGTKSTEKKLLKTSTKKSKKVLKFKKKKIKGASASDKKKGKKWLMQFSKQLMLLKWGFHRTNS